LPIQSEEEEEMPRLFSIRPVLRIRGRKFKGLRGFAGKPFHPPLTDIPVACYFLIGIFDLISFLRKDAASGTVARDFFISGTHILIVGAIVGLPTMLTGFWDWLKSTQKGTQARRTANFHMTVMFTMSGIALLDILVRLGQWDEPHVQTLPLILSLVVTGLTTLGAAYGGALVYDYGFNVETSGDHPVWHESEVDHFPGDEKHPA
jgi:uncharacterized membrane protein